MIVNTFHEKIFQIEDFITKEESEQILKDAKRSSSWDQGEGFWENRITEVSPEIPLNIHTRLSNLFISHNGINALNLVSRFFAGDSMPLHTDEVGHSAIAYGAIIYLNEDFQGGGLHYPDYNFTVEPKARSLVIHPGNIAHQVREITAGTRYFLPTFIHSSPTEPAILRSFEHL